MTRLPRLAPAALAVLTLACAEPGASPVPRGEDAGPVTSGAALFERHSALVEALVAHLDTPEYLTDGQWQQHYGDAPMYGPAFDLAWWQRTGDAEHRERAVAALEQNLLLVEDATADTMAALEDLEPVAMSMLGLLEAGLYVEDERHHVTADALLDTLDPIAAALSDYLEIDVGAFAADTYGPTAISSFVALLHLEHALAHPEHRLEHHMDRAAQVLENIHEKAWDDDLAAYLFAPDDPRLMLYPNITMMLAWGRLYQLAPSPKAAARIAAIHAGIQPLLDTAGDHYHSPYSAQYMGATDSDYSTLSSQNYLMLALWLGWQATGEDAWLAEIDAVLGFLEDRLLLDGRLVHHWMNGAPAEPDHAEYFCTGCNLQTLYLMMQLD